MQTTQTSPVPIAPMATLIPVPVPAGAFPLSRPMPVNLTPEEIRAMVRELLG